MAKQGQGVALDPPGAKPLDLKYMKINGFPKAAGLWWVQGKALALAFPIDQSVEGLVLVLRSRGLAPGGSGQSPASLIFAPVVRSPGFAFPHRSIIRLIGIANRRPRSRHGDTGGWRCAKPRPNQRCFFMSVGCRRK